MRLRRGHVPLSATRRAGRRATLAGFGTAGVLVAAVALFSVVVVGVVAFRAWPSGPATQHGTPVALGTSGGGFVSADGVAVALAGVAGVAPSATAGPSPVASGPAAGEPGRPVVAPEDRAGSAGGGGGSPVSGSGTGSRPVTGPGAGSGSPLDSVADATTQGSGQVGSSISAGGASAAAATRPVSDPLADAVAAAGQRTGDTVAAAGAALAEAVRAVVPPPLLSPR